MKKLLSTQTEKILLAPVSEWPQLINSDKRRGRVVGSLQEMESELSALVQRAALLEVYLSHRYNTGCGDQGHEDSAKKANRSLLKVRKALGFSYPDRLPVSIS